MNKKHILIASILLSIMIFPVSASAVPDLIVAGITTGPPSFISSSEVSLPLTVTIMNVGELTGTRFKLSVEVIDSSGRFVRPYTAWRYLF